jgi:two-component system response regulator YesN
MHIIFVTAFDHFDYAREAIRLGVDEYLVKPASPDEIRRTVVRIADRIVTSKAGRNEDGSISSTGRKAMGLLEEELRSDLARGDVDSQRMISFLRLKGFELHMPVAAIIRFSSPSLPGSGMRQAQLRRVMDLMEHQFRSAGSYVLSGTDGTQLRCIYIQTQTAAIETGRTACLGAIKASFQKAADNARAILGLRILIGASPFTLHDGLDMDDDTDPAMTPTDPFVAAADALSIAGNEQAVVILDSGTASADDANRQCVNTVERAIAYMHDHLSEDISLADVAASVGTAPSHLSRLFSRHSGDTFIHVLCRLRIDMAKKLLRTNQYRVKEVYTMVGFNDQAYFSRVFKKYEGTSPLSFRSIPE